MMDGSISIDGIRNIIAAIRQKEAQIRAATMKEYQKCGLNIIADAQTNLRTNGSVVTGLLRQSGKVQKVNDEALDVGFFDTQNKQSGYAAYVEYGRRAGRMPPPDMIEAWVYKKFHHSDHKVSKAIAWAMARKIAKEGTRPHPFFVPAIDKNKGRIQEALQQAINDAIR